MFTLSPTKRESRPMPVTARLSRKFYDTLGEEIAQELVDWFNQVDAAYRADLREFNELNYARFDAKVEQRFAESDAKWERRFAAQDPNLEQRLEGLDFRYPDVEGILHPCLKRVRDRRMSGTAGSSGSPHNLGCA